MRFGVRIAFVLGAVVALAAAAAGIIIYANNPGGNFYLIGWDELQHRQFADVLLNDGAGNIFTNALQGEALTGDATWGAGLVIGLSQWLFGTQLAYIVVKWVLHVIAALLLYGLVARHRNELLARYICLFFLIYPPLLVYSASFLKDDLVASLVIIVSALIDRRRYLLGVAVMLLLLVVRANAGLFPMIFLGWLWRARLSRLLLLAFAPLAAALFLIQQGYFERLMQVLYLPPLIVVFYVVKFLVGPLPTNILNFDTEAVIIFPWYLLSFVAILVGFFLPGFYSSLRRNWFWILALLAVSLLPYLPYVEIADVIGPRQFSSVGWLYLLLFYELVLSRFRFTVGLYPAVRVQWQPAT